MSHITVTESRSSGSMSKRRWYHDPEVRKNLARLPKNGFRLFGRPFFLGPEDLIIPMIFAAIGDVAVFATSLVSRLVYQKHDDLAALHPGQCSASDSENVNYITWTILAAWSMYLLIDLIVLYITPKTNMFIPDWRHQAVATCMYFRIASSVFLVIVTAFATSWYVPMRDDCFASDAGLPRALSHLSDLILAQLVISWFVSVCSMFFFLISFFFARGQGKNLDSSIYLKRLNCLLCCCPSNRSSEYVVDPVSHFGSEDSQRGNAFDSIAAVFAQVFSGEEPAHLVPSDIAVAFMLVHGAQQLSWIESGHQRLIADYSTRWEDKDAQTLSDISLAHRLKAYESSMQVSNDHQNRLLMAEASLATAAAGAALGTTSDVQVEMPEELQSQRSSSGLSEAEVKAFDMTSTLAQHTSSPDSAVESPRTQVKASGFEFSAAEAFERGHEQSLVATVLAGAQPELHEADWLRISEARRYARFASGAYGWALYAFENGPCKTCCAGDLCYIGCGRPSNKGHDEFGRPIMAEARTCCGPVYDKRLLKNSGLCDAYCCNCSAGVFLKRSRIDPEDILTANLESVFGTVSYYVVRDRPRRRIVIVIRGTMSMGDTLTDLDATTTPIFLDDSIPEEIDEEEINGQSSSTTATPQMSTSQMRSPNVVFSMNTSETKMRDEVSASSSHHSVTESPSARLRKATRKERDMLSDLHVGATAIAAASSEPDLQRREELTQMGAERMSGKESALGGNTHVSTGSNTNNSNEPPRATQTSTQHSALKTTYYAHSGIARSALWLLRELLPRTKDERKKTRFNLSREMKRHPGYSLVVCGHSLGAAVTTLLTAFLMEKYPSMRAYAYAPPPCVDKTLADRLRPNLTSIVYGADIIGRLSLPSLFKLKRQMRSAFMISHSNKLDIFKSLYKYQYRDMFITEGRAKQIQDPEQRQDELSRVPPHWILDEDMFPSVFDNCYNGSATSLTSTTTTTTTTTQNPQGQTGVLSTHDSTVGLHRMHSRSITEETHGPDQSAPATVVSQTTEVCVPEDSLDALRAHALKIPLAEVPAHVDKHPHAFALTLAGRIYHVVPNHTYQGKDRETGLDSLEQPQVLEQVLHNMQVSANRASRNVRSHSDAADQNSNMRICFDEGKIAAADYNENLLPTPNSKRVVTPSEARERFGAADYLKHPRSRRPLNPRSIIYPAHARMFEEVWVSGSMFLDHMPNRTQLEDIVLPSWAFNLSEMTAADLSRISGGDPVDAEDPGVGVIRSPLADAKSELSVNEADEHEDDEDDDDGDDDEDTHLSNTVGVKPATIRPGSPLHQNLDRL